MENIVYLCSVNIIVVDLVPVPWTLVVVICSWQSATHYLNPSKSQDVSLVTDNM